MNMSEELEIIEALKRLVREAMLYSKSARDYAFKDDKKQAALAYLQRASAKMAAAEALYYAQFEILARNEFEDVLGRFGTFADELVEDFATNHSMQWVDIQFNEFKDSFDNSAFAFENK